MIIPSHPSIRLWQDSEEALMHADAAFFFFFLLPAVSFTAKSRFLAGQGIPFCDESRPLQRVFFLGEGEAETPVIEPCRPPSALIQLVKNSFLLDIEARDMLVRHFDDLTRLSALPIYFRLDYPRDYGTLPAVRDAIVQQVLDLRQAHS
ncbi:MAG: hypothetical protein IPP21_11340 [Betaproteobacteria bacterium]|nr:hypothetical protein [Betaproteobacteria bacterium]